MSITVSSQEWTREDPHSDQIKVDIIWLSLLNLDLKISSLLGWVFIVLTYSFVGFNPIPLDDFSTNSIFNPLVNGFMMLSLNLT